MVGVESMSIESEVDSENSTNAILKVLRRFHQHQTGLNASSSKFSSSVKSRVWREILSSMHHQT